VLLLRRGAVVELAVCLLLRQGRDIRKRHS
jgi:hypothetical protein